MWEEILKQEGNCLSRPYRSWAAFCLAVSKLKPNCLSMYFCFKKNSTYLRIFKMKCGLSYNQLLPLTHQSPQISNSQCYLMNDLEENCCNLSCLLWSEALKNLDLATNVGVEYSASSEWIVSEWKYFSKWTGNYIYNVPNIAIQDCWPLVHD